MLISKYTMYLYTILVFPGRKIARVGRLQIVGCRSHWPAYGKLFKNDGGVVLQRAGRGGGEARRRDKCTNGGAHVENVAPSNENISAYMSHFTCYIINVNQRPSNFT